ncbi:MAG TPA: transposase [Myxococcales bacterium]|nr:transposase [Myxococcales bacterium]
MRRADFAGRNPVHVTQRMRPGVGHLRTQVRLALIKGALCDASGRFGMQVVHFSVQGNHLHLIIEAEGKRELSRAMKGLAVRIAVGLNRLADRRGTVFADRYHAHVMETPREVANTIRYVLQNYRKHAREEMPARWRDPFASSVAVPLHAPKVWLLRVGWTYAAELRMAALGKR